MTDTKALMLYFDRMKGTEKLTDEQFGGLVRAMMSYAQTGEMPEVADPFVSLCLDMLKSMIDDSAEKYVETIEKRREAGKKGNEKRWGKQKEDIANATFATNEENEKIAKIANIANATFATNAISQKSQTSLNKNENENKNRNENENKKSAYSNLTVSGKPDDAPPENQAGENSQGDEKPQRGNYAQKATEIIGYLNAKLGTNYKATSKDTCRYIKARLNDGFTADDFKTVIDKKADQWLGDPKMVAYLRPETLFGSKFEGYLNEVQAVSKAPESVERRPLSAGDRELLKEMQRMVEREQAESEAPQ